MGSYSAERKEAALRRMLPPENLHIPVLAKETGIPEATLYTWRKRALEQAGLSSGDEPSSTWSTADKFSVVVETASLNEHELGEYCRRKGLYAEQVSQWREKCLQANASSSAELRESRQREREAQGHIRELQRELKRKEKALAETAALLVLRKKAQAIWGESGDE